MANEKLDAVLREVEQYFGFLHDRGYVIRYADYSAALFGNWVVEYDSVCCAVYVTRDQGDIIVELSLPGDPNPKDRISLEKIIYIVAPDKKVAAPPKRLFDRSQRKQLRRMAQLLSEHLAQITAYFSQDPKQSR